MGEARMVNRATGSIKYLVRKLEAKRFAEIPIERFHIFQLPGQLSLRPHIKIEDGILKEHRFPRNQFLSESDALHYKNSPSKNVLGLKQVLV